MPELELSSVYQILKALAKFDMDEAEECLKELYKNRYAEDVEEVTRGIETLYRRLRLQTRNKSL